MRIKKEWIGMFALVVILSIMFVINLDSDAVVIEVSADLSEETSEVTSEETKDIIKVYISGEVVSPGVYDVTSEDRLDVLIIIAGGFTDLADTTGVNLARKLRDGEMVVIHEIGNEIEYIGLDRLNYGQLDDMRLIDGIGEVLAKRIIKYRTTNGLFTSYDELLNIEGIGEQKLALIRVYLDN